MRPGRLPVGVQLFQNLIRPPRQNLAALRTASTPNAIADRSIPRPTRARCPKGQYRQGAFLTRLGCDEWLSRK